MKRHDPFSATTPAAVAEPPQPNLTPPDTSPAPPARKGGLKKLSFGKLPEKKTETKTAYPVFDHPEAALIAARIKTRTAELEALEGALAVDKAELKQTVGLFYFQTNHGKREVPSSISVPSPEGEVLVTFQNRYGKIESEDPLFAVLGEERTAQYFRCQDIIKIACDQLPIEEAQNFVNRLQELVAEFNATDAVEIKSDLKPVKQFHALRHVELSVEENRRLDEVCPIVTMIKTRGRDEAK